MIPSAALADFLSLPFSLSMFSQALQPLLTLPTSLETLMSSCTW